MTTPPPSERTAPNGEIAERLARFARTNNSLTLWPTLTEARLLAARGEIERVVRRVLAGETPALDPHGESTVYAMRIAAYTTGTGALLGRWIEDGRLGAGPGLSAILAAELAQGRLRAARIEREVLPAIDALLARGITPTALKGFHVARTYVEEPGVRPSADVDLLVPAARVAEAERALEGAGFARIGKAAPDPYKRTWRSVNVDPRMFSLDGVDSRNRWEIDLHTSFDRWAGRSRMNLDAGAAHVTTLLVAGRTLRVPAQPLLLMVLACQLSTDINSMRLMRTLDLVRVIRDDLAAQRLQWDELMAFTRRTDTGRFAYIAFVLANDLSPGVVPARVLAELERVASWGVRHVAARLKPGGASFAKTSLVERFMWARNPPDVLKTVLSLIRSDTPPTAKAVLLRTRYLARRIVTGAFALTQPDER